MQFEWDENKNKANIAKHGIGFEIAKDVFNHKPNKHLEKIFKEINLKSKENLKKIVKEILDHPSIYRENKLQIETRINEVSYKYTEVFKCIIIY